MAAPSKKLKPLMSKLALKTVGPAPVSWYPGHMAVAMRDIRKRFKAVDLVLEVRDARIPLSSANDELREFTTRKKHMILLNKSDLVSTHLIQRWKNYFEKRDETPIFINAHARHSVGAMLQQVRERLSKAIEKEPTLLVMIAGYPNVGKSVLTNAIYQATAANKSKRADVGPLPGVTRTIAGFKIHQSPSIYLLDTPGVMVPKIKDLETGLKLALTGAIKDSIIGEDRLARYLLAMLDLRRPLFEKKWKIHAREGRPLWEEKGSSIQERNVRQTIASSMLNFPGNLEEEDALCELVDEQMYQLRRAFSIPITNDAELGDNKVARKLLEMYRGGKLGSFVWDTLPEDDW